MAEVDTIVAPARLYGFKETFLVENRWYLVRIHSSMKTLIKYIAAYQVAPIPAITYIAQVSPIQPWQDTEKVVLNFHAPAWGTKRLALDKGTGFVPRPARYRWTLEPIENANCPLSVRELWPKN